MSTTSGPGGAREETDRWAKAVAIVRGVADLPDPDRQQALADSCEGDAQLRDAVDALLAEHDEHSEGLWDEVDRQLGMHTETDQAVLPVVEGVELTGVLGRGGSGDVYVGRQLVPEREVAVKVLRSGLASRRAVQRFNREARALAAIDHEAVASIYAVGEAHWPSGAVAPCLVMEHVQGQTLRDLPKPLSIEAAAVMVAKLARGLHAVHQRGVIHRDVKPSNVIIEDSGNPKIIDFGVAALNSGDAPVTMQTVTGELLGTLGYMSPEQLEGSAAIADVRTDVYALGVLFYELVTGEPAVDASSGSSLAAIQTISRGALPRLPITGDPDAIYRKATAHDADRRYDSAAGFAEDLDRLVEGRPVQAQAPSTIYSLRLFVRRNPVPVALGALASVAVLALTIATGIGFVSASRERDAAQIAERRAVEASQFLRDMLASPDPEVDGPSVRVVDLLDRSGELVDERHSNEPLVAMDLHRTLGWTYAAISQHPKAVPHFERAIDLGRGLVQADGDEMLQLQTNLADSLVYVGEYDRAVQLMNDVVARCESGTDLSPDTITAAYVGLAEALRQSGVFDRATAMFARALELAEDRLGATHPQTLAAISGLGRSYLDASMSADAQLQFLRLIDILESQGQARTYTWYIAQGNLGIALATGGEHEAAIERYEIVMGPGAELMGRDHYTLRMVRGIVGDSYFAVGRTEDALRMGQLAIDDSIRINGAEHPDTFLAMSNHAVTLMQLERYEDALPFAREVVDGLNRELGEDHPHTMIGLRNLAGALNGVGRKSESVDIYYSLLDRQARVLGDDSFDTILTKNNLAFLLYSIGRGAEGVPIMAEVIAAAGPESGLPPPAIAVFRLNYGRCLLEAGELDLAESELLQARELNPDTVSHVEKVEAALERLSSMRPPSPGRDEPGAG